MLSRPIFRASLRLYVYIYAISVSLLLFSLCFLKPLLSLVHGWHHYLLQVFLGGPDELFTSIVHSRGGLIFGAGQVFHRVFVVLPKLVKLSKVFCRVLSVFQVEPSRIVVRHGCIAKVVEIIREGLLNKLDLLWRIHGFVSVKYARSALQLVCCRLLLTHGNYLIDASLQVSICEVLRSQTEAHHSQKCLLWI